ncbi:peroxiredoxin-like family protein [Pseudomonadota bacterium]|uniref:peroxiredoxin-like family protein n=1 Tax=unclassified Shewanella TaxID=196818 RepID=UPI000C865335|nr:MULTISPECIES: peroxiredoxin-like family protein [unclassified Shewanella]MDO6617413.1 peroxiredoxin-like family protein [Shewanella sp. 6_MG-2023]MDO6638849.1 peroxiredoxin-like family protein [Shewanella sp. 5_MG-2023]MDO6677205.1 peroxiredoxin-like family protein [Shewanella sp. 4_MG-2023]
MLKKLILVVAMALFSLPSMAKPIASDEYHVMPLMNGQQIPNLDLKDVAGNKVNLLALTAAKPTIFFFYRGGWCPFCNVQMGQLKAIEPKLIEMGFQLVGISPDSPAKLKASMNDNKLDYLLLSDENMTASQAFGIAFYTSEKVTSMYRAKLSVENTLWTTPAGEQRLVLPVPAVYLADKTGLVHFQYINPNYKVRPAPELILTAAKLLQGQ